MSRVAQPNGDDHAEAAGKHLDDARVLEQAGRPDGAAYLAGYVVECCLKTLVEVEGGAPWGHEVRALAAEASRLSACVGARTAKYVSGTAVQQLPVSSISSWHPPQRYRAPGHITPAVARVWVEEATAIYDATIVSMRLDGVL